MKVAKIMHKGATTIAPDTAVAAIAKTMAKNDIGAMPVASKGKIVGMVTDRDIACRAFADGLDMESLSARDIMSKKVVSCQQDDEIEDALKLMRKKRVRRLVVLDGKDKVAGMLSLGDMAAHLTPKQSKRVLKAVAQPHL